MSPKITAKIGEFNVVEGLTLLCRANNLTWRFVGSIILIDKQNDAPSKR
jgi:hypothetical protein